MEKQFKRVLDRWALATLRKISDGSYGLIVPGIAISAELWDPAIITLALRLPVGWPAASPGHCVWTMQDIHNLLNPTMYYKEYVAENAWPEANAREREKYIDWFGDVPHNSWRWSPQSWDPNRDNMFTYVMMAKSRFASKIKQDYPDARFV